MSDDIDIGQISEALNDKLDRDVGNPATLGESRMSGLPMPSTSYDELTIGASGTEYTAPANGWFVVESNVTSATVNYTGNLLNKTTRGRISLGGYAYFDGGAVMPVQKGHKIVINYRDNVNITLLRFVYAKGEENV